jgi:kynurenine formamidase
MTELGKLLGAARAYDLAQPYFVGMPHYPTHPPFLYSLSKKHGDYVAAGEVSSASEALALGSHTGTHMDALCHYSRGGKLHGGIEAAGVQSYGGGIGHLSIETVGMVMRRAVLLDIAAALGALALETDFAIQAEHLDDAARGQQAVIERGDIVLLRTGWGQYWNDPPRYLAQGHGPGPEIEGARWLSERGVFAVGSDTLAFEKAPNAGSPVHAHLLVDCGIHIFEALNLEEIARDRVTTFLFVAAPLKIRGGTGSPVRPFALVL